MDIKFFIDGAEVNDPMNIDELAIELNFDKDATRNGDPVQAVSLNTLEFGLGDQIDPKDGARIINERKDGATTTGKSVFIGLPLTIKVSEDGQTFTFEKYINLSTARYECDKVFVETVERKNIDWFRENIDGRYYRNLFDEGAFTSSTFIPMPYINSELPENREIIISVISLVITVETLVSNIQQTIEYAAGIAALSIANIIQLLLRIFYILVLFATVLNLFKNMIRSIIQPTKFIHGMRLQKLLQIGAESLDLVFESPIIDNDPWTRAVVFPRKETQVIENERINLFGGVLGMTSQAINNRIFGYQNPFDPNSRGFFKGTFGDLLRRVEIMFKAKVIIEGNKMKLVRQDFNTSAPNYEIPPIKDEDDFTFNANEFISNYSIRFLYDYNDKNTVQNADGAETTVTTKPIATTDPDLVLTENAQENVIEFARASRKEELTSPERIIQSVIDLLSTVTGIPQQVIQFIVFPSSGLPGDRIGMMLMENDFMAIDKIALVDINTANPLLNKISTDNDSVVNSGYLWANHHKPAVSFVPSNEKPNANQYKLFDIATIPQFCFADYVKLVNNNKVKDKNGKTAEVISALWNLGGDKSLQMNYKVNELYDNKLQETVVTEKGN